MTLDRDLYNGNDVPVRYDLIFDQQDNIPVFFFSAPTELWFKDHRLVNLASRYQQTIRHIGDFFITPTTLGFGEVFRGCDSLLPLEGFQTWRAVVPKEVLRDKGSNWLPAYQLSATLCILTYTLEFEKVDKNALGLQQLLIVRLICHPDMHGGDLAVTLSPVVRQWIESNRQKVNSAALESMVAVFDRMWPSYLSKDRQFRLHSFRARHQSDGKGIMLDVPGDACGLYIDGLDLDKGPGWHLDCHNVDSPIQQFSLLAGLCTMIRLVRESQLAQLSAG